MCEQRTGCSGRGQRDAVALVLLFLALFLLIALGSYLAPLLGAEPTRQQASSNLCGVLGFYTAHYLFSFFGLIAFFPLMLLGYALVLVLSGRSAHHHLPSTVVGISGLLLSASGLFGALEQLLVPVAFITPGGYLGMLIWHLLSGVIGSAGSVLALCLLMAFSLMSVLQGSSFGSVKPTTVQNLSGLPSDAQKAVSIQPQPIANQPRKKDRTVLLHHEETPPIPTVNEPVKRMPQLEHEKRQAARSRQTAFSLPPFSLLDRAVASNMEISREHYYEVSATLMAKLQDFGVQGTVAGISPGPVVTTYEFSPAPGVKINRIVTLADDLAMVLKVDRVRIVGSIPGKAAIGIEIPNPVRATVCLYDILESNEYQEAASVLSLALGFDVIGRPVVADLVRMPHLLIAGATGAGKSVAINAFIASILYKATPQDVRLLMIDPKRVELSVYDDIPHLLHPVVVEAKMASRALLWAVREMERRYRLLEERRVKSFVSYNQAAEEKLPYIVIIVDELADLMMVASKDVETSIARLAQMARAAGMHIILATQRPSVDVLTGLIKANFPTRISFKVSSKVDSRTILDGSGAEHLLGMGDMLFLPPGAAKLLRIHGAFISEEETERLVSYLKEQGVAEYDETVLQGIEEESGQPDETDEVYDEKYDEAVAIVSETGQASISMVQRRLRVGYNRAARMIEIMEKEGIVGPSDGSRPREVLVRMS